MNFSEDNEGAKECQNEIQNVMINMFSHDSFDMSLAKPISDIELLKIIKEHNEHSGIGSDDKNNCIKSVSSKSVDLNEHFSPDNLTIVQNNKELSM
jgi:hypothetical protein